ncbi:hypothetical protein BGZ96_006046 [Linnemannia gamsii]|uniref:Uncharacterized protein n=1 Tax=Linnemannia gamsii TaxID=64522 RepID=A0ABQ7K4Q3_9FUNG|nr:hypothetical protein BGZ96_006046 [Linnemannia gamsii]
MLTVSLIVVFVILAGMGLVVYCLFRRRSAKKRMHGFGGIGGKNNSGSLGSSVAAGGSGIGSNRKSMTARRQSSTSLGGGNSVIDTGKGGDPMASALAEMQEQQRRISDVDMSRALQQNALLSRRSSTLSLGGFHHHNHHQYVQQNQHPGGRVVSPTLGPARPQSAMTAGYWGSSGPGPAGDSAGEGSRRASMSGESIVIGSGDYVAGPLESSPDFRTTVYDELYYPSRQFLYPSGGGSSGANSNEQLLPPQHQHSNSYSNANMSRRSSLSPAGAYVAQQPPEMSVTGGNGQNPSPIFRTNTINTSSGQNYQQQMQYQQYYPPQPGPGVGPHRSNPSLPPPHLNRMSTPQPPAAIGSRSNGSSETTSKSPPSQQHSEGAGVGLGETIPRTSSPLADPSLKQHQRHPRRPQSMSMLRNNPPFTSPYGTNVGPDRSRSPPPLMSSSTGNLLDQQHQPHHRASYDGSNQLIIPPSITTRRRSMMPGGHSGGPTSPGGGGYVYQQGYHPHQHPYGGQDYFQEGHHQHTISPRSSVSPYGHGGAPYQYPQQQQQQYVAGRSSTQLTREHDHHEKSELIQDEGAGVGVGSSIMTYSSSSSSSGGASSTSTISTPIQPAINLNSVRAKSPPPPSSGGSGNWSGRSNHGNGPKVYIAPAPSSSSSSSSSRASASAAAAGLTISTPVDRGPLSAADLQLTEVLNSPTDSSAH